MVQKVEKVYRSFPFQLAKGVRGERFERGRVDRGAWDVQGSKEEWGQCSLSRVARAGATRVMGNG